MAIAPSKLGQLVTQEWTSEDVFVRRLRELGLVSEDASDSDLWGTVKQAREEHAALSAVDQPYNSPNERVRVFLAPFLSDKGTRWAVSLDSLRLPDDDVPSVPLGVLRRIIAVLLLIVLIGGGALLVISWARPSGELLTVARPAGGTLSGPGIKCGTLGGDCSTRRPTGETIELAAQADAGFVFRGYADDCAPGGLMIMKAARTCGATFEVITPGSPVVMQTLTISPVPTGGTLEGIDILCGTKGSYCSAKHPEGVPVELHPTADPGFTFMGFVGDCVPLGHMQMTGARTCSAMFSPTDLVHIERPSESRPTRASQLRGLSYGDVVAEIGRPSSQVPGQLIYKTTNGRSLSVFLDRDRVVRVDPPTFDIRPLLQPRVVY